MSGKKGTKERPESRNGAESPVKVPEFVVELFPVPVLKTFSVSELTFLDFHSHSLWAQEQVRLGVQISAHEAAYVVPYPPRIPLSRMFAGAGRIGRGRGLVEGI